jgi:quinol-cytochrome oxidoreductase complex cytochrome b subunit
MREGRGGRISVPSAHSHIEPKWALFFIYQEVPATNEIISGVLIARGAIIGSLGYKATTKDIEIHS